MTRDHERPAATRSSFYSDPLDVTGDKMVRKTGRWTQEELAGLVPALVSITSA